MGSKTYTFVALGQVRGGMTWASLSYSLSYLTSLIILYWKNYTE